MKIIRIDPFTGQTNSLDINVSEEELNQWRFGGKLIQDAMPNITPSEREFIKTGITEESWNAMVGEEDK